MDLSSLSMKYFARGVLDKLRFSPLLSDLIAQLRLLRASVLAAAGQRELELKQLLLAARRATVERTRSRIAARLRPQLARSPATVSTREPQLPIEIPYTIVLKAHRSAAEKGVILSTVESSWTALGESGMLPVLLQDYDFVGVSAWSPADYRKFADFRSSTTGPVYICISNDDDLDAYRMFAPLVQPVPLMASDWLDPSFFSPKPRSDRDIDIVMVAGWGKYKRHWLLFEALAKMRHDLRVMLIGADNAGRTVTDVKREAREMGVRQAIDFRSGISNAEVREHLCNSKISLLLSGREGACVAVTESLFADTPVGMMRGAHVGAIAHINQSTGRLLDRTRLSSQLDEFLAESPDISPRGWAEDRISCHVSSARLSAQLRDDALRRGQSWSEGIVPMRWSQFAPDYVRTEDRERMNAERHRIMERFGLKLAA